MTEAIPYSLRPKATKLATGPDGSLKPSAPPTDPLTRMAAPFVWPRVDKSKGPAGPGDAPLAPPGTDPAKRSVPPSSWPTGTTVPNRPVAELVTPAGTLDPDIALWREVRPSVWPFTGSPTTGVWPQGWMGVDNTGQLYVCTASGSPGTWKPVGFTSAGVASFDGRTGAVSLTAGDVESTFTEAGQLFLGTGPGTGELLAPGAVGEILIIQDNGSPAWFGLPNDSNGVSSVPITTSFGTIVETASLAVGIWLINAAGYIEWGGNNHTVLTVASPDTASAIISGIATAYANSAGNETTEDAIYATVSLTFFAEVTVAGKIKFAANGTFTGDTMEAFGYTAVRIG